MDKESYERDGGFFGKKMICLFYLPFKSLSCIRFLRGRKEKELGMGERVG